MESLLLLLTEYSGLGGLQALLILTSPSLPGNAGLQVHTIAPKFWGPNAGQAGAAE